MMSRTITMSPNGRLTLPADARRALGLEGEAELEIHVDTALDELVRRPVVILRREDAWAYTPEHRVLLTRAHADSAEGRVHALSEDELAAVASAADPQSPA
jgi:bifunctional DNA-binding transcriptional regulator/antitoxin component of YhaV-PrlF toxin-antitoxin module